MQFEYRLANGQDNALLMLSAPITIVAECFNIDRRVKLLTGILLTSL